MSESERLHEYIALLDSQLAEQVLESDRLLARIAELECELTTCGNTQQEEHVPLTLYRALLSAFEQQEVDFKSAMKRQADALNAKIHRLEADVESLKVSQAASKAHHNQMEHLIEKDFVAQSLLALRDSHKAALHEEIMFKLMAAVGISDSIKHHVTPTAGSLADLWVSYLLNASSSNK